MGLFGLGDKEIAYYPGCYSLAFLKDKVQNYKNILNRLGIKFSTLDNPPCCGGCLIELGYKKQARRLARDNLSSFADRKTKKIITNCPLCLNTLSNNYGEMLPDWKIDSEFILNVVLEKIKEDSDLVKFFSNEKIIYYDSCSLGRYLKIHESPREILKLLGYNLVEMKNCREETICCGSCGQLDITNPELAKIIAFNFLKMIKTGNIKKVITADPRAYNHLKKIIEAEKIDVNLIEFSDILCDALDIEKSDNEAMI